MRRIIIYILSVFTVLSCQRFDYESILEQLRDHEERIAKLEAECRKLNSNIEALQTVLEAVASNDYVTEVVKIVDQGVEIGYSITFAKGGTVNIYHGIDGSSPKIGIRKASDGEYYWTSDDEWMTDEEGNMIPAAYVNGGDGRYITPQFRIAEGVWYISYDNGNTWKEISLNTEEGSTESNLLFKDVTYDGSYLYIVLADGTPVSIPTKQAQEYPEDDYSIHISFDDVVASITNLSTNTYESLFDEPFFGWLQDLHREYGAKFSLYVYNLSKLSAVPDTYKEEFFDARHWLKFGLHAKTPGHNYASDTYDNAQKDWNTLVTNIIRITGSHQSIDRIPRLHNFAGNLESVKGMRDAKCGALGFLGADDKRLSYHLTEEQNSILINKSKFEDTENGLTIYRTNYRGEFLNAVDGMYEKMESFLSNYSYADCFRPFVWFTHESYIYKNSELTDYSKNVEDVCRFAYDLNIPFVYPQNLQ